MPQTDFIGIYPRALSAEFCAHLIKKFESSEHVKPGRAGDSVDREKKLSQDLLITGKPDWAAENEQVASTVLEGLTRYYREHPFLLCGAITLSLMDPSTGTPRELGVEDIQGATDPQLASLIRFAYRLGTVNVQKYERGVGGFPHWHSEIAPTVGDPKFEKLHRVLLWMFYLNDVEVGGETSFYYQDRSIAPRAGTMVVAPAGFTHTHRGEIPRSGDKYILTSWVLFAT